MIAALIRRDAVRGLRAAGLPVAFFLIAATLFPFAVGPDAKLLAKAGGGMLWLAALLAALLPIERLVAPDAETGMLDQFAVRGIADESVAAAKIVAHWLGFGPPLMIAALPGAALLGLDTGTLGRLEAGLAIGTPALAALERHRRRAHRRAARRGRAGRAGAAAARGAVADLRRGRAHPRRRFTAQASRRDRASAHLRRTLCGGCCVTHAP